MIVTQLTVRNFRSLVDVKLPMNNLNVVIGPNGSGKTALMEVLLLLGYGARGELSTFFEQRGGYQAVFSQLSEHSNQSRLAVEVEWADTSKRKTTLQQFAVELRSTQVGYEIATEVLYRPIVQGPKSVATAEYAYQEGKLHTTPYAKEYSLPKLRNSELVLTQLPPQKEFRDAAQFREAFAEIELFPPLPVNPRSPIRLPQSLTPATAPGVIGDTLYSALYNLRISQPEQYDRLLTVLMQAFPGLQRLEFPVVGAGMVTMTWYDRFNRQPFYPNQLSEGTLRFLWLVTLLMSSQPSTVLLLDEPEVNLHPQLIRLLVALLQDAALRRQIVVATHSSDLVSWLAPDEVIVVDKEDGRTQFTPANTLNLAEWLADYSLRDLWHMGHLGGRT